jgi:hypothetical protein
VPYPPPTIVGHGVEQMELICYVTLGAGERKAAGASLAGPGPREICGKAVFSSDEGFYLFSCDESWHVMFDSNFQTPEEAEQQAEFEHPGISKRWVRPKKTK